MVIGIRKVPGSSLSPKTAYYEKGFSDSSHSVHGICRCVTSSSAMTTSTFFQKSFCQSTLWYASYWKQH